MATLSSVKDVIPDAGGRIEVDENVLKVLPPKAKVLNSVTYGTAAWTRAARIDVELEDGTEKSYFLKAMSPQQSSPECATEDLGKNMMTGEFASLSEIAHTKPALIATPHGTGQFANAIVPTYFLLMEFLDIETGAPDPSSIGKEIADLHARARSPDGRFGFRVNTYHGPNLQNLQWEESWSFFFGRLLRQFYDSEISVNGPSRDGTYEAEFARLFSATLPALLEPLQAEGRHLPAVLVHGDLWEENCGTELLTGHPKIFDAACLYAHNEYELGMWRRPSIKFSRAHFRQYLRHMAPSEPKEQWDDRNRLYSIKFELAHSIGWAGADEVARGLILADVVYLNQKYAAEAVEGASEEAARERGVKF